MNLAIVGAGYVGLVTAAVFSDFGNQVIVIEIDKEKIKKLANGQIPFYEPGLGAIVAKNVQRGALRFTSDYQKAIPGAEIVFICVGTPTKNGQSDLSYLYVAAESVAKNLKNTAIIVIKSTVPPGINDQIKKRMAKLTKVPFALASVPEFLREGKALEDSLHPYRVVIGAEKKAVAQKLLKLHERIPGERLICLPASAQLIKYASNAFLPMKISFANSVAVLCDKFKADAGEVTKGLGMDRRIGPDFLGAGLGYGGSCFPKDVAALITLSQKAGFNFEILKGVAKTNERLIDYFVKKVSQLCGGSLKGKALTILGLAFKPGTSDMREARSIYVIKELQAKGASIRACDPIAIDEAEKVFKKVELFTNPYKALQGSDGLILVTEWEEYKKLDFGKIKKLMRSLVVVDGRNIYNRKQLEDLGFIYGGIGK